MRGVVVAAVALSLVVVGAGSGALDLKTAQPALQLMRASPLQVRGTGFGSGERVRIVAVVRQKTTERVRANGAGTFSLRFPDVSVGRCAGFSIFAIGARGSRAHLTRPSAYCPRPR